MMGDWLISLFNSPSVTAFINFAFFVGLFWAFVGKPIWSQLLKWSASASVQLERKELMRRQLEAALIRKVTSSAGAFRIIYVTILASAKMLLIGIALIVTFLSDLFVMDFTHGDLAEFGRWSGLFGGFVAISYGVFYFFSTFLNVLRWHGWNAEFRALKLREILILKYRIRTAAIKAGR